MPEKKLSLSELLTAAGRKLREDFREIQEANPHSGDKGIEAEEILKQFLAARLPKRFGVESGIVFGQDGAISRQSDIIIYDALNSPIYRTGPRLQILPRDNVAAVIEVKSKLSKEELQDAARKIASVKSIKASPICGIDQPVTFSDIVMTGTLGCVFAFDSYTSLPTLAENLRDINSSYPSDHWIDLVVVLDKGLVGFALQSMLSEDFMGWLGGPLADDFLIPPYYVHLVHAAFAEKTLNQFFLKLMAHLTFFRKISAVDFDSLIKEGQTQVQTIQGYQYNLSKQLAPAEEGHQAATFKNPKVRFNLYLQSDRKFAGQVCFLPWQDGAVITCSSVVPAAIIFERYFRHFKKRSTFVKGGSERFNYWMSSVLPIGEAEFIQATETIHTDCIVVRDTAKDKPPPLVI